MMIDLCNTEEQMQSMTVRQLKDKIMQKLPGNTDSAAIRLIFADKELNEDSQKLSEYGVQHMSVLLLVLRVPGGRGPQ